MGDKRFGSRPAVNRLQDRRLDLQEIALIQELAQRAHHAGAGLENLAHIGVDRQVSVALPVTHLRVGQRSVAHHLPVHHFILGSRQRRERFSQHTEAQHLERNFAGAGAEHLALRLDEVTQVIIIRKQLHALFTHIIDAHEQLHAPRAVFHMRKGDLAHDAHRAQPASQRDSHNRGGSLSGSGFCALESLDGLLRRMGRIGAGGIGFNAHAL